MHTNAYNVFLSDISKGRKLQCKNGAIKWHELSQERKDDYKRRAAHIRRVKAKPTKEHRLSKIRKLMDSLADDGVDSAFLFVDKTNQQLKMAGRGRVYNIVKGVPNLAVTVGIAYGQEGLSTSLTREALRDKVRMHLKQEANACGLKKFPFKKMKRKEIKVIGWPKLVPQREINSMSKADLLSLLDAKLHFQESDDVKPLPEERLCTCAATRTDAEGRIEKIEPNEPASTSSATNWVVVKSEDWSGSESETYNIGS